MALGFPSSLDPDPDSDFDFDGKMSIARPSFPRSRLGEGRSDGSRTRLWQGYGSAEADEIVPVIRPAAVAIRRPAAARLTAPTPAP